MSRLRFDWRWVAVIVVVAVMANARSLPAYMTALILAGGGGYLLYLGWNVWNTGTLRPRAQVTYWRGQRVEKPTARRGGLPSLRTIGPAVLYLVLGAAMMLGAVTLVLRMFGL